MPIQQEPTRELRRLATRIEAGIGHFLAARGAWATGTKWEALRHAWSLSNLALRHAEATILQAKTDMALAPSAWVTARAATEAAARCLWLLRPEDPWEREARWLALLREGARLGERAETKSNAYLVAQAATIREFAEAVEAKLPDGVRVSGMASMQSILAEEGAQLAEFYVLASQYTHGAELATRAYRVNLGIDSAYGDFVDAKDWFQPVWVAWLSFRVTAVRLISERNESPLPEVLALIDNQIREARDEFVASLGQGADG